MGEKGLNTAGSGLMTTLTVVFVVLKVTGVITWSWLWVFSPMWLTILLFLVGLLFFVAIVVIKSYFDNRKIKREKWVKKQ